MFDQIVQNIFNLVFSPTSVPSSWSFWQILACFRMPPTFSTAFKGMSAKAKATKVINPKHHHLVTPENAYIANTAVNYQEKSPRPSLTTSKNRKPILKGGLFMSFICTVFENHRKKSHFNIASYGATFTFWVDKSSLKMPKNSQFWRVFEDMNFRSNSVTR